ncbi:Uncharacterised protein [Vibrio cholerae]|nr:Uncharacterised protein [Vibrio cholerae]
MSIRKICKMVKSRSRSETSSLTYLMSPTRIWYLIITTQKPSEIKARDRITLLTRMRLRPRVWCGSTTAEPKPFRLNGLK